MLAECVTGAADPMRKEAPEGAVGPSSSGAAAPAAPVAPPPPPVDARPAPARNQKVKPQKGKKVSIDPVDFLSLRAELMDVKARLMAAEQSRAIVESRLAALDATALALSNDQSGAADAAARRSTPRRRATKRGGLGKRQTSE